MPRHPQQTTPAKARCPHSDVWSPSVVRVFWLSATVLVLFYALMFGPSSANAISFQVEFRQSTYQVVAGNTYADLVLEHQSGTLLSAQPLTGVQDVSSTVLAATNSDYSTLISTSFIASVTGTYTFQVGTDWGRGGASIVTDDSTGLAIDQFVTTADIWWNNDWANPDVFASVVSLEAGKSYSLGWVGFEGCCGGNVTFRFSVDGAAFQAFEETAFAPFEAVPEPSSGLLVMTGLVGLGLRRSHRRRASC